MERRDRPRTPGWTYGIVRWDSGEQSNAIIWDLSDGGVAVEVAYDSPSSASFLLGLSYRRTQVAFPLTVVSRDWLDGRPLVHARFGDLSEGQSAALRTILAEWRQDMDCRQLWLTTRTNDPVSQSDMVFPGDVVVQLPQRKAG